MIVKIARSRAVARMAIAVLAIGVFVLAGLALWGTSTTQRATAQVEGSNERGVYWGQLFDHVNLEEDMMQAYASVPNDSQRAALMQTIGGADPILVSLERMGDIQDRMLAMRAADAYHDYTTALKNVLDAGKDPVRLDKAEQRGGFAADAVRQLVSASMADDRQQTRLFNEGIDQENRRVRVATTIAFAGCLGLLAICSAVLLGYQRRVERQAASHRHDSLHDALTGLPNRTLLAERTDAALRDASGHGDLVGMLLIDLNGFKKVNDTLGHRYGDLLLQQVAERLRIAVRHGNTVARIGGDEFAVLLPRVSSEHGATEIAQGVLDALRRPVELDGHALEVGGSIGVALYPTHCFVAEQLLQYADIAMYTAKRGRLGVQVYDLLQNEDDPRQLTLLAELQQALDTNEITVHYQPKVDLETHQVCGVEALARWHHPQRGAVSVLEFIPLAEEGGLIDRLTQHVLSEALEQCRRWRERGVHMPVAVNLSARCLADPDLSDTLARLLREATIPPAMLTLEITESTVIRNQEEAIELLLRIRQLGVRLSVDDFGTGYASMTYLRRLPVSELKIDRCFVSQVSTDLRDRTIVRTVLELARDLGVEAVAEGIEDQDTCDRLRALGCRVGQGYLFSKPLAAADLEACLARLGVADQHGAARVVAGGPM